MVDIIDFRVYHINPREARLKNDQAQEREGKSVSTCFISLLEKLNQRDYVVSQTSKGFLGGGGIYPFGFAVGRLTNTQTFEEVDRIIESSQLTGIYAPAEIKGAYAASSSIFKSFEMPKKI